MVISTNPKPEIEEFLHLLDSTTASLNDDAITQEDYFISNSGSRLENIVCERMGRLAEGSNFEGTIKLISGQRFPDIVANKLLTWVELVSEHSKTVKFNPKPILIKKLEGV